MSKTIFPHVAMSTVQSVTGTKADQFCGLRSYLRAEIIQRKQMESGLSLVSLSVLASAKLWLLMLHMTKPIHGKGKVVTINSGFCVAVGIIEMHKRGVFGQALIKKRGRYWPKYVPGDEIDNYFAGKELGETMLHEQEVDGVKFLS